MNKALKNDSEALAKKFKEIKVLCDGWQKGKWRMASSDSDKAMLDIFQSFLNHYPYVDKDQHLKVLTSNIINIMEEQKVEDYIIGGVNPFKIRKFLHGYSLETTIRKTRAECYWMTNWMLTQLKSINANIKRAWKTELRMDKKNADDQLKLYRKKTKTKKIKKSNTTRKKKRNKSKQKK